MGSGVRKLRRSIRASDAEFGTFYAPKRRHRPARCIVGTADDFRFVPIERLRPTQVSVGMRSVAYKRCKIEWKRSRRKRDEKILIRRPIPSVRGPGGEFFIIDHHHFALALWHAAFQHALAHVIEDLSHVSREDFWVRMERSGRLYPFDEQGRRVAPDDIPNGLHALRHDPFRDLAWQVREAGGFRKVSTPYAEFKWGNYFRERIARDLLQWEPDRAFALALDLCRSSGARNLPGFVAR